MPSPDLAVVEALRASPIAAGLSAAQIEALALRMSLASWPRGSVLAQEGEVDERMFVVVEGAVGVARHHGTVDESLLATLRAGDLVHELGFLDGTPRHASLVAAEPVRALVLTRRALEGLIDVEPRLLYAVMCAIVRAAHVVQSRLSAQAVELTNYVVKQHGRY